MRTLIEVVDVYLVAMAFGATLLVASLVLGHHGHDAHDASLAWIPVFSLRFWVFFLAFGGAAGFALANLGSSAAVAAGGALGIGWASGVIAVVAVRALGKRSVSSEVSARELVGATGTLLLPAGPGKPGKVRLEVKGRAEDFVATLVEDAAELPAGSAVLVVAEGEPGTLLVAKHEM